MRLLQRSHASSHGQISLHQTRPQRPSRRLSNFVFFSLLCLLLLISIPYGSVEPWWRALFQSLIFALTGLFLVDISVKGDWDFARYARLLPLLALVLFALIQSIPFGYISSPALSERLPRTISADPHATRNWAMQMIALVLFATMLLRYTNTQRRFKWLVYAVVGVALASAIFGVYRQMVQYQPGFGLPNLRPGTGYGQFINKDHFAFLIEMAFGLVIGLIVWRGLSRDRMFIAIALAVLLGCAVVLADSRGGILSLFCEVVSAALLVSFVPPVAEESGRRKKHRRWAQQLLQSRAVRVLLIISISVVVVVGVIWIGGSPLSPSPEAVPADVRAPSDNSRLAVRRWDIWPATWRLIIEHPVAGVGFGGYWMAVTKYHNASGEMTPQQAHNDYFELVASGGVIAIAIAVWFVFGLVRAAHIRVRAQDRFRRAARCGAILGISGVAVHSFVDFGLHIPANAAVLIALFVICTVEVTGRNQKSRTVVAS